jgi:hypothetical protein
MDEQDAARSFVNPSRSADCGLCCLSGGWRTICRRPFRVSRGSYATERENLFVASRSAPRLFRSVGEGNVRHGDGQERPPEIVSHQRRGHPSARTPALM